MKQIILLSVLSLFICCKENKKDPINESLKTTNTSSHKCSNEVTFGDIEVCLPEINGIVESFKNPIIKERALNFEDAANIILGYYVTDEIYKQVENLNTLNYDNFYKVYASKQGLNYEMKRSEMKDIMNMMTAGFIDKKLEETNEDLKNSGIEMSQPILLEKYNVNKDASSMIILMRINNAATNKLTAISMSSILIKERLLFVAHYLDYKDENTINVLKRNSNTFINEFIKANNVI